MLGRERAALSGYTALVAVVLAVAINWQAPQNFDSGVRVWLVIQPWSALLHNVSVIELAPPLWHVLGKAALAISPVSPIPALRALNYVLFLSLVPVGYWAGRTFEDRKTAWGTALLIPWSPYLLDFVTRTDHYTLYMALAVGYTAVLAALLRSPTRRRAITYGGVTAAFAFTHYYALTYVAGTVLAAVAFLVWDHDWRQVLGRTWDDVRRRRVGTWSWFDSPSLVPIAIPALPVVLAYLVWSPVLYGQFVRYSSGFSPAYSSVGELATTVIWFVGRQLPAYGPMKSPVALGVATVVLVTIPLGGVGLWTVVRNRDRVQLVVVVGAVVGAVTLVLSGRFYNPRHGLWMAAIAPLVMALGAGTVLESLSGGMPERSSEIAVAGVLLLLGVTAAPAVATLPETTEGGTNVDRAAEIVRTSQTSDSVILSVSPWGEFVLRAHGVDAPVYGVPEDAVRGSRARRVRVDYAPATHTEDRERVRRLVEGKDRVVVFNAHGRTEGRLPPLIDDLDALGFEVSRSYEKGSNGVVVLDRAA